MLVNFRSLRKFFGRRTAEAQSTPRKIYVFSFIETSAELCDLSASAVNPPSYLVAALPR
jgi:hypothetical protein